MTQRGSVTERKRNAWRGMRVQCRGDCAGTASGAKRSAVREIRIKHREELILRLLPDLSRDDRTPSGIKNKCTSAPDCTACPGDCFYPRRAYPPKDGGSDESGNAGMRLPIDENENLCINIEILFFIKTNQTAFSVFGRRFFYFCKPER